MAAIESDTPSQKEAEEQPVAEKPAEEKSEPETPDWWMKVQPEEAPEDEDECDFYIPPSLQRGAGSLKEVPLWVTEGPWKPAFFDNHLGLFMRLGVNATGKDLEPGTKEWVATLKRFTAGNTILVATSGKQAEASPRHTR